MYSYSLTQWLFFFYFYCFFGWCFESTYVSIKSKKLVNRGFMRGPFLPIYGSGAIMMLLVSKPFEDNLILVYLAGCIGATVLEYVTGVTLEALFKVRYWDYSNQKFNFQGHICLSSTLCWGFLTILMTTVIHKPIENFGLSIIEPFFTVFTCIITLVIIVDFAISFKAAMDLRAILIQMEKAKQELVHIQKRLDVIIAVASEEAANYKESIEEHLAQRKEEIIENIVQKKEELAENWVVRKEEWADGFVQRKDDLVDGLMQRKDSLAERIENHKDGLYVRIEDVKTGIEAKLEQVHRLSQVYELSQLPTNKYLESVKEELAELRQKYTLNLELRQKYSHFKNAILRNMIRSNPTMSSERFRDALEEVKKYVEENRR